MWIVSLGCLGHEVIGVSVAGYVEVLTTSEPRARPTRGAGTPDTLRVELLRSSELVASSHSTRQPASNGTFAR